MGALSRGWLVLVLAVGAGGCMQPPPPARMAKLKVIAEPDTTTVYVNSRYAGRARVLAAKPKSMKPGVKYITFKAPDHFPHDVRLKLPPGTTTVKMKLRPIPP